MSEINRKKQTKIVVDQTAAGLPNRAKRVFGVVSPLIAVCFVVGGVGRKIVPTSHLNEESCSIDTNGM
jgi:hypothetical protein